MLHEEEGGGGGALLVIAGIVIGIWQFGVWPF